MQQEKIFTEKLTIQAIIILFLASCFYLYEFGIQTSPVAIAQELMRDFAIDTAQFGLIASSFYYSYAPLQLTTGLLLDRYSTRVILTCVVSICALGALLFAHAPNMYVAIIARFIIGGASSCAFIGVLHLAVRWVPPTYFALFAGIVEMMGSVGGTLGSEPFAILLKHFDWRAITAGFAYTGFILAFLIALLVRNQPASLKTSFATAKTQKNFVRHNLRVVLQSSQTWIVALYSFLIWAPILGFAVSWGAQFLALSCHLDNVTATRALVYIWLGVGITSPTIGWFSDFIDRRCIIMTICAIAGTIAMTLVVFLTNIPPAMLNTLMFILGFASAGQTLSFALVKDNNSPLTNSTANGFNNMCVVAGGMVLPIIIGWILKLYEPGLGFGLAQPTHIHTLHDYHMALAVLPICYLVAAIVSIFGIKETYCRATW